MDNETAIKVEHVSKVFKLPHERQNSIKGSLINIVRGGKNSFDRQEVLKDISFDIKKGEFFGIVGRNGSGKSTLLKMLAGIYTPTSGNIAVNGKLTPFIELGVGFNPELTGRENVFLNGALLGFSRKEMAAMYDEIVAFAEIEKFMDQKLKNYSSGMQVRLAFSIAIRARTDILVLDEVLAVGDESFQRKCLDVFEDYKAKKQTIVLVTHDMATVSKYCTRAMLISDGKIVEIGEPSSVANHYSQLNQVATDETSERKNDAAAASSQIAITLENADGKKTSSFAYDERLVVDLSWPENLPVKNAGVAIMKASGETIFATNTLQLPATITGNRVKYRVDLKLLPGRYYIVAGLFGATQFEIIDFANNGPTFTIKKIDKEWEGVTYFDYEWLI